MSKMRDGPLLSLDPANAREDGSVTRFPSGIRARLTALTAIVVAIPLLLGVVVIANLLQRSLNGSLERAATSTATTVAAAVQRSGPTGLRAVTPTVPPGIEVQVYNDPGKLVAAYPSDSDADGPISMEPGRVVQGVKHYWLPGDVETPLVVQISTTYGGQRYSIVVSASQGSQHEAVSTAAKVLLAAIPFLVGGAMILAWILTGRTLRPVEAIREQAELITARNLTDRLPVGPIQDEVATLAETMNRMLARLEVAQSSQQRFVADASHELRSPVATLQAALEIAEHAGRPPGVETIALMSREAERLNGLIDGLLLLTRSDSSGLVIRHRDVDLDDLARGHGARLRATTGHTVQIDAPPVRIVGDAEKLDRVLRNLTDNAARHATSWVGIRTGAEQSHAFLIVEDDGAGIAGADRARVFQRFVRLDESRNREIGGSGLGLAIVSEIVQAHGGTIRVGQGARGGAQFTVTLPYAPVVSR